MPLVSLLLRDDPRLQACLVADAEATLTLQHQNNLIMIRLAMNDVGATFEDVDVA